MLTTEEYEKVLRILNARHDIYITTSDHSIKRFLMKFVGLEGLFFESIIGWSSVVWKSKLPEGEVYIDHCAKVAATHMRLLHRCTTQRIPEQDYIDFFIDVVNYAVIHEAIHWLGETGLEDGVNAMCDEVVKFLLDDANMAWAHVYCPLIETLVSLKQCLECSDFMKDESCPLLGMRKAAIEGNRTYQPGRYHVSEMIYPRRSFFERIHDTATSWPERHVLMLGTAIGWYIERDYEHGEYEFEVPLTEVVKLLGREPDPIDDEITMLGHADIVDFEGGLLVELKTIERTGYVMREPKEDHILQARAYMTLGMAHEPEKFKAIKDNKIVYVSRSRANPKKGALWYVEHSVGLEYVDFIDTVRMLHRCVKSGEAPDVDCAKWLCRYCGHGEVCRA